VNEKNKFTYFIAIIGILWLLAFFKSIILTESPLEILIISFITALIVFFPVKLHNHFDYSFDIVCVVYLMIRFDWSLAILPTCICLLYLQYQKRRFDPFRLFLTFGMYTIAILVGQFLIIFWGTPSNILKMLIFIALIDMVSLLLIKGVQSSILGTPLFNKPSAVDIFHGSIPVIFTSILTLRFLETRTTLELFQEVIFAVVLLYLISLLSNKHMESLQFTEELRVGYEMCLQSNGQIFLHVDHNGLIQSFNSIAEQMLGYSKDTVIGTSIWKLPEFDSEHLRDSFKKTLQGFSGTTELLLTGLSGDAVSIRAELLPFTKNKKVSGVYVVGRVNN
jgi:PAS domain S-box-containing protein